MKLPKNDKIVVGLKEKSNYDCIFWDNGCTIYEHRPLQCWTFSFWPFLVESKTDWEEEKYRCRGIGVRGDMTVNEKFDFYKNEKDAVYMKMPEININN